MPDSRQKGYRSQAARHQKQPVERENQQRALRTKAYPPDQKQRQPTGDGPFVPELNEQQQGKEHRAGASEIGERLAKSGVLALGWRDIAALGVDSREDPRDYRHEDKDARDAVGVE